MKENTTIVECTIVFQMLKDIMYWKGCGIDKDHVTWTLMHLDKNSSKGNYIYEENQECTETQDVNVVCWSPMDAPCKQNTIWLLNSLTPTWRAF